MLIVALIGGDFGARGGVVVIGSVLVTGLVVARQFVSDADQAHLRARIELDAVTLRRQEHRWAALAEHATEIMCVVDADGNVTYTSAAVERVLGYVTARTIGKPIAAAVHPDDTTLAHRTFAELLANPGASRSIDVRMRCADDSWRWVRAIGTNLLDDPEVAGVICNARDVTESLRFSEQLRYECTHDPLTRLANRAFLVEQIKIGGTVSRDTVRETMSIVVINLDGFKHVNDAYGHDIGDTVLSAVAGRLLRCARSMDTVARMDGDEFAVLLPATTETNGAVVAERIRHIFAEPVAAGGTELTVGASIGVATGPVDDGEIVLRAAGRAMRAAKHDATGAVVAIST
jgi:diguanylate cyclase (GGDEF)-like protein/PAS domain S-box-containing protein